MQRTEFRRRELADRMKKEHSTLSRKKRSAAREASETQATRRAQYLRRATTLGIRSAKKIVDLDLSRFTGRHLRDQSQCVPTKDWWSQQPAEGTPSRCTNFCACSSALAQSRSHHRICAVAPAASRTIAQSGFEAFPPRLQRALTRATTPAKARLAVSLKRPSAPALRRSHRRQLKHRACR